MPTFAVFARSVFAFVALAVFAIGGFVFSDTRQLDDAMLGEPAQPELGTTSSPSIPASPQTTDTRPPATQATVPPTTVSGAPEQITSIDQLPQSGDGTFIPASSTTGETLGSGNIIEFSVAAEQATGINPDELAATVDLILGDERSWIAEGTVGFRRIESGGVFTLVVATADTVDRLCAPLRTNGIFSCAQNGWIAINLNRWSLATTTWTADLADYRDYVINHEVGHYLARPHIGCPGTGQLAPVMMQQTKGVGECQPNGWPYPDTVNP